MSLIFIHCLTTRNHVERIGILFFVRMQVIKAGYRFKRHIYLQIYLSNQCILRLAYKLQANSLFHIRFPMKSRRLYAVRFATVIITISFILINRSYVKSFSTLFARLYFDEQWTTWVTLTSVNLATTSTNHIVFS